MTDSHFHASIHPSTAPSLRLSNQLPVLARVCSLSSLWSRSLLSVFSLSSRLADPPARPCRELPAQPLSAEAGVGARPLDYQFSLLVDSNSGPRPGPGPAQVIKYECSDPSCRTVAALKKFIEEQSKVAA